MSGTSCSAGRLFIQEFFNFSPAETLAPAVMKDGTGLI
jgi:hypothetical protein